MLEMLAMVAIAECPVYERGRVRNVRTVLWVVKCWTVVSEGKK